MFMGEYETVANVRASELTPAAYIACASVAGGHVSGPARDRAIQTILLEQAVYPRAAWFVDNLPKTAAWYAKHLEQTA
jgi:hypothetical protein